MLSEESRLPNYIFSRISESVDTEKKTAQMPPAGPRQLHRPRAGSRPSALLPFPSPSPAKSTALGGAPREERMDFDSGAVTCALA